MKSGLKSEKRSHRLSKASEAVLDGSKAKCPMNCLNALLLPQYVETAATALAPRKADRDHWETLLRERLSRLPSPCGVKSTFGAIDNTNSER